MQAYLIHKSLASSKRLVYAFSEALWSLLTILDDFKGYTIIPFVPHTVIFALKTAQT